MKTVLLIILLSSINLFAGEPVVVDTTGLDFQNYWYTGTFGQQIVVDDSGKVHVCYNKTWCTESDTGWQVMYANVNDRTKIPLPSQQPERDIQPGVVYMDGGHGDTPVYFYYGVGSRFYGYNATLHLQALARLNDDGNEILPAGLQDDRNGYSDMYWLANPIEMEVNNVEGIVHCINASPNGAAVIYWNSDGTNFSERWFVLDAYTQYDIPGKSVPMKYRRNATKGADIAVSFDGMEVTIATLHPACNILLHKGYYAGEIWEDDFYDGLANGSVIALFDTTNSEFGTNIPNNDPKPYTEVQVSYDEDKNLHVVYDATYFDVWLDTSRTVPWGNWWAQYSSMVGDTNAVFYDGREHPKPQLRYWNSITKTHTLLAECEYPNSGETYQWYNYGIYDSSAATWGKYINDGPIANVEFFVNRDQNPGEPKLVCVWEEMQGDISILVNSDTDSNYNAYSPQREDYYAYMKDIKISVSKDGLHWSAPYNITNTPNRDESEVSVYRNVIDNKIHLVYSEDGLPGSDLNLCYVDEYEDKYIQNWPGIDGHFSVPIRKETTEQVQIVYREFDLSTITNVKSFEMSIPKRFELAQNYPNPFNPTTKIQYQLPENTHVELVIYNVRGQKVQTLVSEVLAAGIHKRVWDGRDMFNQQVSSGIYFYQLKTKKYQTIKKMILVR